MTNYGGAGRTMAAIAAVGIVAVLVVAATASVASAAMTVDRFIGGASGGGGGQFIQPRGVAIYNATGDIYVAEGLNGSNHRISRYSAEGVFELMWGRDVQNPTDGTTMEICTAADADTANGGVGCKVGTSGPGAGELSTPVGIAVDQSDGSVYVHDQANRRVQRFDANGQFILMFGKGVNQTTGGDVCTATSGDVCQAGTTGSAAAQFGNNSTASSTARSYLAVHPGTDDVFIGDPVNRRVMQYESDGDFLRAWGFGVDTGAEAFEVCTTASSCQSGLTTTGTENGRFGSGGALHLAIDGDGVVYASDPNLGHRIVRFDSDGFADPAAALLPEILASDQVPAGVLLPGRTTTALAMDAATGNLLVVRDPSSGETRVQEIDPSDASLVDTHGVGDGLTTVQGAAFDPVLERIALTYAAETPGQGFFLLDADGPSTPTMTIQSTTDIDTDSATLHGTINPNGFAQYRFEYSTDGVIWQEVTALNAVSGTSPVPATCAGDPSGCPVNGLQPNTAYRVRMFSTNTVGGDANGAPPKIEALSSETTFMTAAAGPDATTLPPAARSATAATLQARVDPNGSATTYHFEYGTTTAYGQRAPASDASAGDGGTPVDVSQEIFGLAPNTVYHYRVVAENEFAAEPVRGADVTFATRATADPPPGRAYELVTPPDKSSGPGVGGHGNHSDNNGERGLQVGLPSVNGQRVVSGTTLGAVLLPGASVYGEDYVLSDRTSQGWVSRSAFNRPNYGASLVTPFFTIKQITPDLSTMLWDNPGGEAALFSEMAAWPTGLGPTYARDWTGNWELIQPTEPTQGRPPLATLAVLSEDGTQIAITTSALGRGMLGSGDPSLDQAGSTGTTLYTVDTTDGLSNTFAGRGPDALLIACTGSGSGRTVLPKRLSTGKLDVRTCPPPTPPRTESLIDPRGGSLDEPALNTAISRNGSRVFFTSPDPSVATTPCSGTDDATACPAQVYVRQEGQLGGEYATRWVSRPIVADQDASLLGAARFEGASKDGDKVFFSTTSPLTPDDPNGQPLAPADPRPIITGTASASSHDLYSYDLPDGDDDDPSTPDTDPAGGVLTRISAGPLGTGDCNVTPNGGRGSLRFVSEGGDQVYFTCSAPLPGVPGSNNGTITDPGGGPSTSDATNLYLYDSSQPVADRWTFVARLPRAVGDNIAACATTNVEITQTRGPNPNQLAGGTCMRGTADGKFITFWTAGRLLADDPDTATGDIYAFDADDGELTRISAPQGGAGGSYSCLVDGLGDDSLRCYGDGGFGTLSRRPGQPLLTVATKPTLPGDRRVFFESRSQLVPQDTDDHMDVYQWRNGELALVSTDLANADAFYSGNSQTGDDVFIVTPAALTWQDIDGVKDVYDVRVGGGFDPPPPVVHCDPLADSDCPGSAPPPPASPSPGTGTPGQGNAGAGARTTLSVRSPSTRARRRAARRGVLSLTVRTSTPGVVRAVARARIGKKVKGVARRSVRVTRPGKAKVPLRLSRAARRALRRGNSVRLRISVTQPGARPRSITVALRRPGR